MRTPGNSVLFWAALLSFTALMGVGSGAEPPVSKGSPGAASKDEDQEVVLVKDAQLLILPLDKPTQSTIQAVGGLNRAAGGKGVRVSTAKKGAVIKVTDRATGVKGERTEVVQAVIKGKADTVEIDRSGKELGWYKVSVTEDGEKSGGKEGWVPAELLKEINVFEIVKTTGKAKRLSYTKIQEAFKDGKVPEDVFSGEYQILRMRSTPRLAKTTQDTLNRINDPSGCSRLVRFAVLKLQEDASKYAGAYPEDYYCSFSMAVFLRAIDYTTLPWIGMKEAGIILGKEVKPGSDVLPAYHIYEAIVPINTDTEFDKVQHFSQSAYLQYFSCKWYTDLAQYAKEIGFDEVPSWFTDDKGFDRKDMKANNLGQKFGKDVYDYYDRWGGYGGRRFPRR